MKHLQNIVYDGDCVYVEYLFSFSLASKTLHTVLSEHTYYYNKSYNNKYYKVALPTEIQEEIQDFFVAKGLLKGGTSFCSNEITIQYYPYNNSYLAVVEARKKEIQDMVDNEQAEEQKARLDAEQLEYNED